MKTSADRIISDLTKALTERSFIMDEQWALNLLHETASRLRAADALYEMVFQFDQIPAMTFDEIREAAEAYRKACGVTP